jgi:uncharacterized protein YbaP (TraB family)
MKLTHRLSILFGILLLFTSAHSQLLYRISGNGLKQDSYLFGTIHTMPKEDFEMPKKVMDALKSCGTIALEIDLNMSLSEKIELAKMTMLPNGGTLKDYMPDSSYTKLKSYCMDSLSWKESKFEQYSHMKPFFFQLGGPSRKNRKAKVL